MQYDDFVERVQKRANLSREDAHRAVEATLATLGERLYRTEREHLAAELPDELKSFVLERAEAETTRQQTDRFRLEEFYNRVTARAEVRYQHGVRLAQAVMEVLREATSPGQWEAMRSELRDEYRELFGEPRRPQVESES